MGSSSSGKKHKKDKKHKHRHTDDDADVDMVYESESGNGGHHRHHKHKKHKDHKERVHKHTRHPERERRSEVIAIEGSDSDSSDCVEVPVDPSPKSIEQEPPVPIPPPPQISKHVDVEHERWEREHEREKDKERERERLREYERAKEKEKERERDRERERERYEKERERYEREREMERRRVRDLERERDRDRERDRGDRDRERERDRVPRGDRIDRERDRHERERHPRDRPERERPAGRDRSFSPIPESGAGDCLSIEETNKLRAKLGLKPLEMDSGPSTSAAAAQKEGKKPLPPGTKDLSAYKDEWGEFLHKPADNIAEKKEAEKIRDRVKQRKEKRFLEERLARIRTLGESDEEVDDISKWVERNKRSIDLKKEAEMRAKALEEMDAEFGVDELVEKEKRDQRRKAYNDRHLKGLRVEHDVDDFAEGKTVILTLKDKDVLDEENADALINVNMLDDERYRKNVENKKKNPLSYGYNVYEEQYDMLGNPIERGVLEKYDEDLDGNKTVRRNFVIGEDLAEERSHKQKLLEIKTKLAGKRLETLADATIELASDTLSVTEMEKFKKPKRKVKKLRQKLKAEDLLPLTSEPAERNLGSRRGRRFDIDEDGDAAMDSAESAMPEAPPPPEIKVEEDDDPLERVLSKARKLKQKENIIKKSLPKIDMEQVKMEIKSEPEMEATSFRGNDGNIVLNATAEFCRTLGDIPTYGLAGNRTDKADIIDYEKEDEPEEQRPGFDAPEISHGTWNSVNPDEIAQPVDFDGMAEDVEDVAILDEEPDVGAGVANALRLALSKGYLEKEERKRPSNTRMAHLQAKNYSIDDKATGEDEKFGRRDRFHAGPISEFREKETFKPNVKLEYIDDNGRILNLKEAFRYLSHKFHGKGPGKNKVEKRLKKMEQEGLMKTMSSTDTPLGTLTMLQQKQKETKTPYVVLSGGKNSSTSLGGTMISKYKL